MKRAKRLCWFITRLILSICVRLALDDYLNDSKNKKKKKHHKIAMVAKHTPHTPSNSICWAQTRTPPSSRPSRPEHEEEKEEEEKYWMYNPTRTDGRSARHQNVQHQHSFHSLIPHHRNTKKSLQNSIRFRHFFSIKLHSSHETKEILLFFFSSIFWQLKISMRKMTDSNWKPFNTFSILSLPPPWQSPTKNCLVYEITIIII